MSVKKLMQDVEHIWGVLFLDCIFDNSTKAPATPDPIENIQHFKGNLPYCRLHATNANHILSVGSIQIYSTNNIIELNDDISASVLYV